MVKRHRYAEKMEEEVKKLKEKKRGLGIDPGEVGTTVQSIGVEAEEEDTVLEHKTIKKAKVEWSAYDNISYDMATMEKHCARN